MSDEQNPSDEIQHLDLVSSPDSFDAEAPRTHPGRHGKSQKQVRILFGCCNVYASLPVPDRVRGKIGQNWRVHCVRCGRLVEIPVD